MPHTNLKNSVLWLSQLAKFHCLWSLWVVHEYLTHGLGFLSGSVVKRMLQEMQRHRFNPWVRKTPGRRK